MIKFKQHTTFLLFCWLLATLSKAQQTKKNIFFTEGEYMIGRIVPNYVASFPNSHLQHGFAINFGTFKTDSNSIWTNYYNYPQTGISLFYSYLGNNDIFGQQFSIMPFISFNVFKKAKKPYYIKLSIGASYFTTGYDSIDNSKNINISSPYNWGFQMAAYKTVLEEPGMNVKIGLIYSHASNGHTQLPNFGINSGLISLSTQFFDKKLSKYQFKKTKIKEKNKSYNIGINYGIGLHEYGDVDGPIGGDKKPVQSTSIFAGKTTNSHFRWNIGFTYRFYHTYYQQIVDRNIEKYTSDPNQYASNFVFFSNVEFLMSHFSIDVELGVNLYKPFYRQYEKDFPLAKEFRGYMEFKSHFKRLFSTKLGLNFYMINTNKLPKHNFFIGPHIKTNAGQADFSEIAFGYVLNM